ncbi:DUF6440 family protein [Enterococcus faecalis]|uniref:DUF6440 family protein n=1 Tax=Enterococcus faecalis TaxID=1351 RepID=UPI0029C7B48E|nr:DUF6440 family protein [Enterococcus faecalis]WPH45553.1 DUF6440 family protein [Enterococcus faecalis]
MPFLVLTDSEGYPIDKDLKNTIDEGINPSSPMGKSENSIEYKRKEVKKRFIEKESESLIQLGYKLVVDTVTGVNYLESPRGGITPLLDETGKVCIDKISK